jgi:caffeoyl-CoA O-methyltransferase
MTTLFLPKSIDDYAEQFTTPESPVLAALNRETNIKRGDAVMLSGQLQGSILKMMSQMIKPTTVLEIGTFTGYSAICLAAGLQPGGHLHTIEIDEELEDIAATYFKKAGLQNNITQHIGTASAIIQNLTGPFDLVFIDADKTNYGLYYDLVFDKVPVGGYIIADNVLYGGEVILPEDERSKNGAAICFFNEKIKKDNRIEHLLMPVRDGLMIMRKVNNA